MRFLLSFIFCGLLFVSGQALYADKVKETDPIKKIQSYRNIDNFRHFFSAYAYKNEWALQYQNQISPGWLLGVELKHTSGYEKTNIASKIPRDFNDSPHNFAYQYAYREQVRFPFAGIQSREDVWNFAVHAKYFLFNTPFYLNGKVARNLSGGGFHSREILFSELGYSVFCNSSGLEGSCATSSGAIQAGSLDIKITERKQISFYTGLGLFYVFQFGFFVQVEMNYLLNEKKYKVEVSNDFARGSLSGVEPISLLEVWVNQKYLESKFTKTGRWDPIFYLGYATVL